MTQETLKNPQSTENLKGLESELVAVVQNEHEMEIDFVPREFAINPENEQKRVIVGVFGITKKPDGTNCMIIQKRSSMKSLFPEYYTFAASGHINPQDLDKEGQIDFQKTMEREFEEETTINLKKNSDGIGLISSLEIIESQEEGTPNVLKQMVLGAIQVDYESVQQLLEVENLNPEVDSILVVPIEEILQEVVKDEKESKYKFTPGFRQSMLHIIQNSEALLAGG